MRNFLLAFALIVFLFGCSSEEPAQQKAVKQSDEIIKFFCDFIVREFDTFNTYDEMDSYLTVNATKKLVGVASFSQPTANEPYRDNGTIIFWGDKIKYQFNKSTYVLNYTIYLDSGGTAYTTAKCVESTKTRF